MGGREGWGGGAERESGRHERSPHASGGRSPTHVRAVWSGGRQVGRRWGTERGWSPACRRPPPLARRPSRLSHGSGRTALAALRAGSRCSSRPGGQDQFGQRYALVLLRERVVNSRGRALLRRPSRPSQAGPWADAGSSWPLGASSRASCRPSAAVGQSNGPSIGPRTFLCHPLDLVARSQSLFLLRLVVAD